MADFFLSDLYLVYLYTPFCVCITLDLKLLYIQGLFPGLGFTVPSSRIPLR